MMDGHLPTFEQPPRAERSPDAERKIVELRAELARWQHDTTGAWKGDRMGVDAKALFESNEKLDQTHLIHVRMGELDRLNDVGGDHSLGDAALKNTVEAIARIVGGGQSEIYRTGMADFSVLIRGVDIQKVEEIVHMLSDQPIIIARSDRQSNHQSESTYLSATHVAFSEAKQILDQVQTHDEDVDATMFISILKEKAYTLADFESTKKRLAHVLTQPREIYEKYHKNAIEAIVDLPEPERLEAIRKSVIERFHARNLQNRVFAVQVLTRALERIRSSAPGEGADAIIEDEKSPVKLLEYLPREIDESAEEAFETNAHFLGKTRGEVKLLEAEGMASAHAGDERFQLELEIERAKRDRLTGLSGRGIFFEKLRDAAEMRTPHAVIAVDMAFLKYFDKLGGKHTGDLAIQTAGRVLDYAAREVGRETAVQIEACRIGGDEFAFFVGSADPHVLRNVELCIRRASLNVGEIPVVEGATRGYLPERLQFNLGTHTVTAQELTKDEVTDEDLDRRHAKADGQIGPAKSASRLVYLLVRGLDLAKHEAEDQEKVEKQMALRALTDFSEKAIFGETGKKRLAEWQLLLHRHKIEDRDAALMKLVRSQIIPFVCQEYEKKGVRDIHTQETIAQQLETQIHAIL